MGKLNEKKLLVPGTNVGSSELVQYAKSEGAYAAEKDYPIAERVESKQQPDETAKIRTIDSGVPSELEKKKEIGGYFGLEEFSGREYYEDLIAVNNGRNALVYLLRARNIKKLYIPRFLCDSVSGVCQREGCLIEFYAIGPDFLPKFDRLLGKGEWLYIVNYYGQISNVQVQEMKARWGNIIFDNVQAFFQRPVEAVDTIYSCRKFFGVPDGGYVAANVALTEKLDTDISKDRMKHVLGRYEDVASEYHRDFKANDHSFVQLPLRAMSALTHNLLRAVDYDRAREKRNENYAALAAVLDSCNKLNIKMPDGPYCYPLYCKNGMAIKNRLAAEKIYVPTLWPNVLSMEGTLEQDYAENILPLPCDQRYDLEDMARVIALMQECMI